jgi:hypothetical protein
MSKLAVVVVFAIPGRESTTSATLAAVDGPGGGSKLACDRVFFWTGTAPPIPAPHGWVTIHNDHGARGSVAALADFWKVLDVVGDDRDLVFLEDDVMPCRNALPYMVAWASPHVTHFFNGSRAPHGLRKLPPGGFEFSQTLKIPARVVKALRASPAVSKGPRDGWDLAIGRQLAAMGEPLYQHRSLVQHVGFQSMWQPGNNLAKRMPAPDWPGEDFDALTLFERG